MKKLFATLLAATMVAGTSISAFAWRDGDNTEASTGDDFTLSTVAYNKDGGVLTAGDTINGDTKIYYPILVDGDAMDNKGGAESGAYYFANFASEVDGLRVSLDDVRGGRYIDEAKIVRKDVGLKTAEKATITIGSDVTTGDTITVTNATAVAVTQAFDTDLNTTAKAIADKINAENLYKAVVIGEKVVLTSTGNTNVTDVTATVDNSHSINVTIDAQGGAEINKIYCVEVSLNDYVGTQETELEFELKLRTRSTQYDTEDATNAPATYFNLGNDAKDGLESGVDIDFKGDGANSNDTKVKFRHGELTLEINEYTGAIDLSEAKPAGGDFEDVERIFLEGDNFTYEVKASDEGEQFLKVTTDANKNVVIDNERASLDFLNFEGEPNFDFTGTLKYTVEDPDIKYYFYEIVDDKPVETNAKYDSEDECFELRTRTLGSYVISDKPLDVEDEEKEEETTEKPADKPTTEKPVEPTTPSKPSTPNKTVPTGAIA